MFKAQLLIIGFVSFNCLAQNILVDTVYVPFGDSNKISVDFTLDTVMDNRTENNKSTLYIYEKTKYAFIPFDIYENTKLPVNQEIQNSYISNPQEYPSFSLYINEFNINTLNKATSQGRKLYSETMVVLNESDKKDTLGILVHDEVIKGKKKTLTQQTVNRWKNCLANDLDSIIHQNHVKQDVYLQNLYPASFNLNRNFYGLGYFGIGLKSYFIEGEILFSNPEASKKFFRQGYSIRYRNGDNFSSIEFGQINEHVNFRITDNYIFKVKTNLFIGLNKWDDILKIDHNIADILIVDISALPAIEYNPFNKKSVIAGFGLSLNAYYIYSKNLAFDPGLLMYIGIKL